MVSKTVKVNLSADTQARPVAVLVQIASQFESKVHILSQDKKINAKSIMGMMSLGIAQDTEITVEADGSDEQAAVKELTAYIQNAQ